MKTSRIRVTRTSVLACLIGSSLGGHAVAQAVRPIDKPSTKLQLVIVMTQTTGPVIAGKEANEIVETFRKGIEAVNLKAGKKAGDLEATRFSEPPAVILMDGKDDRGKIDKVIHDLAVAEDTTFVLYYLGHAVVDEKGEDPSSPSNHILQLDRPLKSLVRRTDLLEKMKAKQARLTVLITECCSQGVDFIPDVLKPFDPEPQATVIGDLFLRPSGVVDITSSTHSKDGATDERTFYILGESGFFGTAFRSLLSNAALASTLDANQDRRITWGEFFPALRNLTSRNYQSYRIETLAIFKNDNPREWPENVKRMADQPNQTPRAFQIPRP